MSKPTNRSLSDEEMLAVAAVAQKNKPQKSADGSVQEPIQMSPLEQLLLDRFKEKDAKEKDALEKERLVHLQRVEQFKKNEAQIKAKKDNHRHRKPDDRTQFGGQQHSDGRYGFICQGCGKTIWYPAHEGEEEMDPNLMPPGDFIGSSAIGMQRL